jgi:hypothetical protein
LSFCQKTFALAFVLALTACSTLPQATVRHAPPVVATPSTNDDRPLEIQRPAFRTGVSSVSVERLARERGCTGGKGASLLTDEGPVEVYRMMCENGTVFLAKCELRQCRPMR